MKGRIAVAISLVALLAWPSTALGFHCFVAKKPEGKGSAGSATIEVTTEEFTPDSDLRTNPQGRITGGFITLTATFQGEPIGTWDVFAQTSLPAGAHNAGPGDDACDGVGTDDAINC
jgi:hypothetical protein